MKIKVIGIGGCGVETAGYIAAQNISGVSCAAIDTDHITLENSELKETLLLDKVTGGRGAGGLVDTGKNACEEETDEIKKILSDADVIILAAGMGAGTGTGASSVIARIAKEKGAKVLAAIFHPYEFEGPFKLQNSVKGIKELSKYTDSILIVETKFAKDKETHKPEIFEIQFSKSEIKEIHEKMSFAAARELFFKEVLEFVKTVASKSTGELKENYFIGYTVF